MNRIRKGNLKDEILFFDEHINQKDINYDDSLLDELNEHEPKHFWFRSRKEKICNFFNDFIDRKSKILEIIIIHVEKEKLSIWLLR